ncbi:MAG: hypothetical protein IT287_05475 [Bdellovibrionaceae bacterium]|nr:hypothetical protein [Pseudobdellovibrionaceae bacterium]
MKTKLFFLAAAGSMFVAYNTMQKQWKPRVPANFPMYVQQSTYRQVPMNLNPTQMVYSYADVVSTYDAAMSNEVQLRNNQITLQGMLAQEQQRLGQQNIRERANPYSTVSVDVRKIEDEIRKLKQLRQNNLETAYMRIYLTYASIQNPPTDGRPGLTKEQHADARLRLENIATLKQSVQLEGTGYYSYPNPQATYLTAAAYTPALITPPIVPVEVQYDAHVQTYLTQQAALAAKAEQERLALVAPPVIPDPTREGMTEAIPEDPTVLQ